MKIAILSCFYPYRGGIAQFNANIFEELSKSHEVKAFNFSRQYPSILFPGKTQLVEEVDTAVKIPSTRVLDTANPLTYIQTAKAINDWGADLLIMRYWMSWFAPSLGYVARHLNPNTKVISILDNVTPHEKRFFDKPFTKYFLGASDAFVVLSDAVGKDLLQLKSNARYISTPHPLYNHFGKKLDRSDACRKLGLPEEKKIILFFGLIREYKGLDILLEAFSNLNDSFQLVIAGEPYGRFDKYAKLIEASPNRERIKLTTRYIADNEVPLFFSSADVCVLPYRSATQSGISAISYHFTLPMITTDVGGLKEAIEIPGTGVVVKSAEPSLISEAIKEYFKSGKKETYINNIERERERLSWKNFTDKLINLYNNL
ncbi:MAG: glycosyltransferase [Bacteroidales bacterium]|nr:glycosyltransferase [Bacteroidales bacterium]MDD3272502.1 glycosyltransferase [Bacteroidales bacterium]MDD4057834.1 glycosyltransferase [Bacteroidales bacterium]